MLSLNLELIADAYKRTVTRVAPDHLGLAQRTLKRIAPARWEIEWYLPWWLSETFGLDAARAQQFVLSNVLGLAAIRLEDDLADGDIAPAEKAMASELAKALLDAALAIYHHHFPPAAPFWTRVQALMRNWRAATAAVNHLNEWDLSTLRDLRTVTAQQVAALGAPLKIGAYATFELTGQPELPEMDRLLDHALIATVLYDHAVDCHADLRAGRWNLFAAACSNLPQTAAFEKENRLQLIQAWMSSEKPRSYFEHIGYHCGQARQLNREIGAPALEVYLAGFEMEIWQTFEALASQYHQHLEKATRILFGPPNPLMPQTKGAAPFTLLYSRAN
jgi:hypothetical protein